MLTDDDFGFGIEAEYLLVDSDSHRPLWKDDLSFEKLNALLESIPCDDLGSLDGLEVEPPHRKRMPYVVEGYHLPDPEFQPVDLLPKGIEIRTPISTSIDECVRSLRLLFDRLQEVLEDAGMYATAISHHPTAKDFSGPRNKRREDYWRWSMVAMTTFGPDINVSLPKRLHQRLDMDDLFAKTHCYAPALTALTLSSPLYEGQRWIPGGRTGYSVRTYRRSQVGAVIEPHPEERRRLEFKTFEMPPCLEDFKAHLLLWLGLLLDEALPGRATSTHCAQQLRRVSIDGLTRRETRDGAWEAIDACEHVLASHDFDATPLEVMRQRLHHGRSPAHDMIDLADQAGSIERFFQLTGETGTAAIAPPEKA
ncbi:Carboxylate-amine ligase YbdK [Planctomycetes bacterium Pan216]|uniref:Carboxylate-amine ligase YbdK n=1 Tax=Kolteria novifilia TaxID=2527975 RepID=A0A518B014_9BACT|nr:Carboxylate-amine ligase YbdK [Planctomycetes bacterium Pan216]